MISSRNNQQNSLYVNYILGWNVSFLISLKLNAQKCKTPIHNKWSDLKWCEANREQQKKRMQYYNRNKSIFGWII